MVKCPGGVKWAVMVLMLIGGCCGLPGTQAQAAAQRIVSLVPAATEQLFSLGVGKRILATVEYSDYPPPARSIPRIGDARAVSLEAIVALSPDLVVVWEGGTDLDLIQQLERLEIPLYYYHGGRLAAVSVALRELAELTGVSADKQVAAFETRVAALRQQYASRTPVRVFYVLWQRPLLTSSNQLLVGEMIALCGGVNPFAHLPVKSPEVNMESVLVADPQVILAPEADGVVPDWAFWQEWPGISAVKNSHLYSVNADWVSRATLRSVEGLAQVCEQIDRARR